MLFSNLSFSRLFATFSLTMFSFGARKVDYQELYNDENDGIPVSTPRREKSSRSFIIFLALGWATTLILYWHLSISTRQPLGPIPSDILKLKSKTFQHDERYSGMSVETQNHWDAQFAGHGALWVEHPEKYGLSNGIVAEFDHPHKEEMGEPKFFIVSKLHEVHCLSWIRLHWWTAITGGNLTALDSHFGGGVLAVHIDHCFEYLRQALACAGGPADVIVEGSSPLSKGDIVATSVSGWGKEHQCIDFDALAAFQVDQEAKYNLTWQSIG